jgi:hypothetical protein
MKPRERPPASPPSDGRTSLTAHGERPRASRSSAPMARHLDLTRCCSSFEADWSIVSACRVLTEPSRDLGYAFPIALVANAEPVIRASYVNDSNYLRERAAEMLASSSMTTTLTPNPSNGSSTPTRSSLKVDAGTKCWITRDKSHRRPASPCGKG